MTNHPFNNTCHSSSNGQEDTVGGRRLSSTSTSQRRFTIPPLPYATNTSMFTVNTTAMTDITGGVDSVHPTSLTSNTYCPILYNGHLHRQQPQDQQQVLSSRVRTLSIICQAERVLQRNDNIEFFNVNETSDDDGFHHQCQSFEHHEKQ